jgi:hypothetical protein
MTTSEPMRFALVRRLSTNLNTVHALKLRSMISKHHALSGPRARYSLTLTDQGESYATWLEGLGYA